MYVTAVPSKLQFKLYVFTLETFELNMQLVMSMFDTLRQRTEDDPQLPL